MSRDQVFQQAERLAKSRSITFSAACAVIAKRKAKKTKVQYAPRRFWWEEREP